MDEKAKDVVILVMEGIAVGTFLYVTFFEVCATNQYGVITKSNNRC